MCRRQTPGREREREGERERGREWEIDTGRGRGRERDREREREKRRGEELERLLLALYYQPCTRACARTNTVH